MSIGGSSSATTKAKGSKRLGASLISHSSSDGNSVFMVPAGSTRTEVIDSVPDVFITMFRELGISNCYSYKTPEDPVDVTFIKISNKC